MKLEGDIMATTKIVKLILRLLEKTQNSEINWEETENEEVYQATFPDYSIRISLRPSGGENCDYKLSIYNENGNLVEAIWDNDISSQDLPDAYPKMRSLYDGARSKAMKVDEALDSILNELKDEDDIPF